MLGGLLFRLMRIFELTMLIPIVGMLSWFVNAYANQNQLTPNYILVLFIVSTLASVWALVTLFKMDSVRRNAPFVAFIDLCFFGAFIAGVYFLRGITNYNCFDPGSYSSGSAVVSGNVVIYTAPSINFDSFGSTNNTCAMLKASFALGIISVINFFNTAILAYILHRRENEVVVEKTYRRSSHSSRRGHSQHRRSGSRDSRRHYYV